MLRLVILLSVVALAFGATIPDATLEADFLEWSGRIVGGQEATIGQFPYQASMRSAANAHFCGGFIITNNWVGSAAHCTVGRTPANTRAVVGAHNRITGGITHETNLIVNHPQYSSATVENDISLVRTANEIVFTATVGQIALGSDFVTSGNAVASGWGQTSHPGSAAANLQWKTGSVITNADCRSRLSAVQAGRIFDSTICLLAPVGQGLCMGDSGGPLTQGNTIIGAVSWGVPCGQAQPDMFARISSFREWMLERIANA